MKNLWGISLLVLLTLTRAQDYDGGLESDNNENPTDDEETTIAPTSEDNAKQLELEERIKAVIEHFKTDEPKGVPGFPIPDPVDIPDNKLDVAGSNLFLTESKLSGISQLTVSHVKVDLVGMKVDIGISFPELQMQGRYKISSWFTASNGPYNIYVIGVTSEGSTALEVSPDGKIKVKDISLDLKFQDFKMSFENLGFFGSIFQAVINSLIPTIFDSMRPVILGQVNSLVQTKVNEQMRSLDVILYDSITPLDKLVVDARNEIRSLGYDPFPLPERYLPIFGGDEGHDTSEPLDSNVLIMSEGKLSGTSTFYRADNISLAYDHVTKSVTAGLSLGLGKLGVNYDWELKTGWYSRKGTMKLKIDGAKIGVKLVQPANINHPTIIKDLSIRLGNIQVNSKGAGAMDYLVEFTVNAGVNGLRHIILAATEEVVTYVLNQKLKELDLETLILEQLKKKNIVEEE